MSRLRISLPVWSHNIFTLFGEGDHQYEEVCRMRFMSRHLPAKCDKARASSRIRSCRGAVVAMAHLRQLNFPEYTVSVVVDEEKCIDPFNCNACLKNCPAEVFRTYVKNRVKGEICNDWGVIAANDALCWGCGVCTKLCPSGAISIRKV